MDFKITNINNSTSLFLDAPYRDGYENIKVALSPRRITYSLWRVSVPEKISDLSQRLIQYLTGVVLIIPGVNIVADLALRFFFVDSTQKVREPLSLEKTHVTTQAVINKILPRLLDFLDENGMNNSSIHYYHLSDRSTPIFLWPIPHRLISRLTPKLFYNSQDFLIKFNNDQILHLKAPMLQKCENDLYIQLREKIIRSGLLTSRQT